MSGKPTAFITRQLPEEAQQIVCAAADVEVWPEDLPPPREILCQKAAQVEGVLCLLTDKIDAALLDRAPRLRVVSQMAVGYDNIDVAACTARNIPVGNTPGVLAETTADLAFALILTVARRIVEADQWTRAGEWKTWSPMLLTGRDVYRSTLGIVGMGNIGYAVARRAAGFDMPILYAHPRPHEEAERQLGARRVSLEELLAQSDFVSLHTPLSATTRHLIGPAQLALMKPTAYLVNAARGPIVDQKALYAALTSGVIAGAGLDVFEVEPVPADEPLLHLSNVVTLPHIGSASIATRTHMAILAAENLVAGLQGRLLLHCVNPSVYTA
jgi:lactate dehydrogenase-like 2-hydroxyacid dehydrogenase